MSRKIPAPPLKCRRASPWSPHSRQRHPLCPSRPRVSHLIRSSRWRRKLPWARPLRSRTPGEVPMRRPIRPLPQRHRLQPSRMLRRLHPPNRLARRQPSPTGQRPAPRPARRWTLSSRRGPPRPWNRQRRQDLPRLLRWARPRHKPHWSTTRQPQKWQYRFRPYRRCRLLLHLRRRRPRRAGSRVRSKLLHRRLDSGSNQRPNSPASGNNNQHSSPNGSNLPDSRSSGRASIPSRDTRKPAIRSRVTRSIPTHSSSPATHSSRTANSPTPNRSTSSSTGSNRVLPHTRPRRWRRWPASSWSSLA